MEGTLLYGLARNNLVFFLFATSQLQLGGDDPEGNRILFFLTITKSLCALISLFLFFFPFVIFQI